MVKAVYILQSTFIFCVALVVQSKDHKSNRKKSENGDVSLWKKEYELELTDAMLMTKKRDNSTKLSSHRQSPQSRGLGSDNEAVVEKLMDSITASEKYLKKVDSIDFRLNRLDIEVHEKTNNIIKHLLEISKQLRSDARSEKTDTLLETMKSEISQIKFLLENKHRTENTGEAVEGPEVHTDPGLDTRLTSLETGVKGVLAAVQSITAVLSEVKTRQHNKPQKTEVTAPLDTITLINEFRKSFHDSKTRKCECKSGRIDRSERYPTDCHEIQIQGFNVSGIYKIKPEDMEPFYVLCDLTTAGGGWTVLQNRFDGSQDFYKGWSDYKNGFGNLAGEFWLGLEKINYLTNQKLYELRVELETGHGLEAYAEYSVFTVGPEHEGFRISTLGTYYGTAGDSLSYHAGQKFSTLDMDNDEWKDGACATEHGGAWWYKECDKSNLNGKYSATAEENRGQSIYWISFKGPNFPLTKTKMMIRPLPASRPNDSMDQIRKIPEGTRLRTAVEKPKAVRPKPGFDLSGKRPPYRFDDHADAFFPNYT